MKNTGLLDPGCEAELYRTVQPRPSAVRRVVFYLKNLREFVWEPIHRQIFLARQLRAERDCFRRWWQEAEAQVWELKHGKEVKREFDD